MKTLLGLLLLIGGLITPARAAELAIVDTLGNATPATSFSIFGSWGTALYERQLVGPQFTLAQPTVLMEIGGFVNNCHTIIAGEPQCPDTLPFTVQIHPAAGTGGPDPTVILAAFPLSHDNDPLLVSYESVDLQLRLEAGTYFALFVPQGGDGGTLLRSATSPFAYQAPSTTMGTIDPVSATTFVTSGPGAVRIVGTAVFPVTIDIKPGRFPNKLKSNEKIPVAILTTATFDATTVDPALVLFGATGTEAAPVQVTRKDVDRDGNFDLLLYFHMQETGLGCGDTVAILTGATMSGQEIEGSDPVETEKCKPASKPASRKK